MPGLATMRLWLLVICLEMLRQSTDDGWRQFLMIKIWNLRRLTFPPAMMMIRWMKETSFFRQFSIFAVAGGILRFAFLISPSINQRQMTFKILFDSFLCRRHHLDASLFLSWNEIFRFFAITTAKLNCLKFIIQSKMAKDFFFLR